MRDYIVYLNDIMSCIKMIKNYTKDISYVYYI